MSNPVDPGSQPPRGGEPSQPFTQELHFSNVAARVPEKVARGVFSNNAFVIQGPTEFAIDFVLRMSKPHQIVARVFVPFHLVPQVIGILRASLDKYRQAHGLPPLPAAGHPSPAPAPAAPTAPAAPGAPVAAAAPGAPAGSGSPAAQGVPAAHHGPAVNVDEVYQELKMSEEVMCGAYANALLVVHNASEFCLDFIVNLYPRAAVTARIFMSAAQVPILFSSLTQAWQNLQAKQQQPHPPRPPG